MKNIAENQLIRFLSLTKKKDGWFANFRVKGIRGGAQFSTSMTVDISAAEVNFSDPLEKIIEESAKIAIKEFKKSEMHFEGLSNI